MIYENYIRVLYVNLSTGKVRIEQREDLMDYLGGVGVASKLLEENLQPDAEPLHPDQPVIFAIGALSTIFPVMTKTVAMFVSPLTGELGESYAGGRLAMTMFNAGFDAIVLTGKSEKPVYLVVNANDVRLKDARAIWGEGADEVGQIIREREPGGGKRSIIRIGPAGENLISYASVCVDTYRHFGRLGLGACLGSKNLKAMTVLGSRNIPIKDQKLYFKTYREIYEKCVNTEMMSKYHDAGTPINIEPLNAAGGLPSYNLQGTIFEEAENISGETFANNFLVRKMACTGCPVGCIHIAQFRRRFAEDGYEYEAISVGYDYELIYALGTFLGISDPQGVLELIEEVERAGTDAMSTGVALGWATEAYKKGLITLEDTLVPLEFGDWKNYELAIHHIARPKNAFYRALGKGVKHAASIYGGSDFAMQIAGNEMPGSHTGYGALVGAAVGARHSHLCNGGYSIDQSNKDMEPQKLVDKLFSEEVERCMLNSMVMCLFARKVYDRPTILAALAAVDRTLTDEDLTAAAERIYKTKLRIKQMLGFNLGAVQFPKRFFETPAMNVQLDEKQANDMMARFRKKNRALLEKEG